MAKRYSGKGKKSRKKGGRKGKARRSHAKKGTRRTSRKKGRKLVVGRCKLGKCASMGKACRGRPVPGGSKGMATHKRRHHRR